MENDPGEIICRETGEAIPNSESPGLPIDFECQCETQCYVTGDELYNFNIDSDGGESDDTGEALIYTGPGTSAATDCECDEGACILVDGSPGAPDTLSYPFE